MKKILSSYYGQHLMGMLCLGIVIGSIFITAPMIYIGSMIDYVIYPLLIFFGIIFGFSGFRPLERKKRNIILGSFLRSILIFLGELLGAKIFDPTLTISFIFYLMPISMLVISVVLLIIKNKYNEN